MVQFGVSPDSPNSRSNLRTAEGQSLTCLHTIWGKGKVSGMSRQKGSPAAGGNRGASGVPLWGTCTEVMWWRRRELNPRPRLPLPRLLRACPVV